MCDLFGIGAANAQAKAQADKAEQDAKAQEAQRQANIKSGNTSIDSAFSGYNPDYYSKFKQTYDDAYNPDIDTQYGQATDKLTSALAGRGMLGSTYGDYQFGQATKTRDDARAKVASDAENAASTLQGNVENRKMDLYGLNQTGEDPEGIAAQATAASTSIPAPTNNTSLGNIFQSLLQPYTAYQTASQNAVTPYTPSYTTGAKSSYKVTS